jgi:hypothetical protein
VADKLMACVPLIVGGGGVQVVGFGLALRQSVVTRREQSPEEASLTRWTAVLLRRKAGDTAGWLRVKLARLLVRLHLKREPSLSGRISAGVGLAGNLQGHKVINNRGLPVPERLDQLEQAVNELYEKHSKRTAEVNRQIDELRGTMEAREAARESEHAKQLGRRLRAEELGVAVFVVGLVLSTIGGLS